MLNLKKILQKVRDFLFSSMNKEFLIFLFFLCLSGIFWLMMTLNETYEKELPVVLRMTGVPKNVVMTSPITDTARVTVRDKGFVLVSYMFSHRLRPVSINFNTYANKQTGVGNVALADVQKMVRQQLYASSTITAFKVDDLTFNFNYGEKKVVKVTLAGHVVPAKNFYLAHVQFSPEKVEVYANREKLDSILTIPTDFINLVNFDDTVSQVVKLKSIPGVKLVPSSVKVTFFVDILTEESIDVPITTVNMPEGIVVRTFPQRVKVNFTVGAKMFRRVKASDFRVVVDYREVVAHPSDKCNLYLQLRPSIVSNARLAINQVDYLIEQQ